LKEKPMSIEETRRALWEMAKKLSERWPDLRPEGTDAESKPFKHLTMGLLLVELGADMVLLAHEVAISQGTPPPLEHVEARNQGLRMELRKTVEKWLSSHHSPWFHNLQAWTPVGPRLLP
jgi:hypothetical protein